MDFVHTQTLGEPTATDICLAIQGDRLLVRQGGTGRVEFPSLGETGGLAASPQALGRLDGAACWFADVADASPRAPGGYEWFETRALLPFFTAAQLHAVGCARELNWWRARTRFCGCCGAPVGEVAGERARKCPRCGAMFFPAAYPAIIVAVIRGEKILLAHNRNFRPGLFSLLAGFVDPGETLEQAVVREVREEVGIEISNVRYVASQPWPFPNSLMIGFRAEHVGGELVVDGKEIEQAGWFARREVPDMPRSGTVARAMIDAWVREGDAC